MNSSNDESPHQISNEEFPTNPQGIHEEEEDLIKESSEEEDSEYDPMKDEPEKYSGKERKAKRIKTRSKSLPLSRFYDTLEPYSRHPVRKSIPTSRLKTKSFSPTCLDPDENARRWTHLIAILQRWNTELGIPSVTEIGESSTRREDFLKTQEPADHPVPLLIANLAKAEDRIYELEKALVELPRQDSINRLHDRIKDLEASNLDKTLKILELESNIELMTKNTESTQASTEVNSRKTAELERRMNNIEAFMEQITRSQDLSIHPAPKTK